MLAGALDQNVIAHFDAAAANRPLKTVGHDRADQRGGLSGQCIADFGSEDVGRQVEIIGEAAEKMRRLVAFCPPAVIGALAAEALVVTPAIGTTAAAERAFENNAIAFFHLVNRGGVLARVSRRGREFHGRG